jgi:predicted nucleic acid-binding Zn ribbon protein
MPTYVYKFVDTGETIEVQQGFHDENLTVIAHPDSGELLPVKKVFTPVGVTFKGSGFFKTDNRGKKSSSTSGTKESKDAGSSSSDAGSSSSRRPATRRARRAHVVGSPVPLVGQHVERFEFVLRQLTAHRSPPIGPSSVDSVGSDRLPPIVHRSEETPMHVAARARLVLARRPWVYWALVAALAALAAATVHGEMSRSPPSVTAGGRPEPCWSPAISSSPVTRSPPISSTLPIAAVPDDALAHAPSGARVRQRVAVGEVLTGLDVTGRSGPAALAEPGTVVVAISDPLARDVTTGLDVQVAAEGLVIAERAQVTGVVDDVIFIAVGSGEAPSGGRGLPDRRREPALSPVTDHRERRPGVSEVRWRPRSARPHRGRSDRSRTA